MRRQPRAPQPRTSSLYLRVTRRLASSWTSWSVRRTARRLARAESRLLLLELETDRQQLKVKELQSHRVMLLHRQQETLESQQFRATGQVEASKGTHPLPLPGPEATVVKLSPEEEIALRIGLGPPPNSSLRSGS